MIKIVQTCWACPEQYDMFHEGRKVGYIRLRHGRFAVYAPEYGAQLLYEDCNMNKQDADGCFKDDVQRDAYLRLATKYVEAWLAQLSLLGYPHVTGRYQIVTRDEVERRRG